MSSLVYIKIKNTAGLRYYKDVKIRFQYYEPTVSIIAIHAGKWARSRSILAYGL